MLWKCCTKHARKSWKLNSFHSTGKGQFSFQSQGRQCQKCSSYCTIALISHASKVMLKILQAKLQQYVNYELQMFKLVLEKAEEPEIKLPTSDGSWKKQEFQKKHLFLLYWLCQSLWLCGPQQTLENSERDGNTRPPDLPLEKFVCRSRSKSQNCTWNNRLVPDWERSTSRLYKEYVNNIQGCILLSCLFNFYAKCIM